MYSNRNVSEHFPRPDFKLYLQKMLYSSRNQISKTLQFKLHIEFIHRSRLEFVDDKFLNKIKNIIETSFRFS